MKALKDVVNLYSANDLSSEDYLKLKVQWYNETKGNLHEEDGIECSKCNNKGLIEYIKDGTTYMTHCECVKKRNIVKRAKNSGLGEYINKRSNDYKVTNDWQQQNFNLMVDYCKTQADTPNWFAALGQSGGGKTLMCSIIANHLLFNLNKTVVYITWTDFISRLKRDVMSDGANKVTEYLENIKNVEVLFIDELLKKYNETDLKYIIEIINYRYTNNLKTIITSERNIDELLDIDEATFGRMIEKCETYVIDIPKDRSKNYRLRNLYK
jgi:DNA replication protein DnaC